MPGQCRLRAPRQRLSGKTDDGSVGPQSGPARLGPRRRGGLGRVLRPEMLGIAAAHVGADVPPRALPEPRQVLGGLDWAMCGGQQRERQRDAGDGGMLAQAIDLLHSDIDARAGLGGVVDDEAVAGGGGPAGGRLGVQATLDVPGDQGAQGGVERVGLERGERPESDEGRSQPVVQPGNQGGVRQVRPGRVTGVQEGGARPQAGGGLAPGQGREAVAADAVGQRLGDQRRVGVVVDGLTDREAAQAGQALGAQAAAAALLQAILDLELA